MARRCWGSAAACLYSCSGHDVCLPLLALLVSLCFVSPVGYVGYVFYVSVCDVRS